jgi:hypothetical protein
MTLKFVTGRSIVKFHHKDDAMTVAWDLDASLEGDELLEALRRIVAFMDAQTGREPLPERTPGLALEMAQMTHPPMTPAVGNGWAAMPPIPARLEGEVEFIPPEEQ